MKKFISYFSIIVLLYLFTWPIGIDPVAWKSEKPPEFEGQYEKNDILKDIKIFWENDGHEGPEDVILHKNKVYVGYSDGTIMTTSGKFYNTNGRPLGMAFDNEDNLIIADAKRGLLSINPQGTGKVLSTKSDTDNIPLRFTDDLDIANDGKIYFSDASFKYGYGDELKDLMEHKPNGRLLVYNPDTGKTSTLLNDLYFANGVAISPDNTYLLITETFIYRVKKYWLKGEKKGTSEIIIDNLPGLPDNISSDGKDIFWLALFTTRNQFIEQTSDKPFLRKVALRLPSILQPKPKHYSFVLGISGKGEVIHNFQNDSKDSYAPITSVNQYGNDLYFGSLSHKGWGKMKVPE